MTLHIPPHNPTCLFTPWLLHAPSEPLPYPLDNNTFSSAPTQLLDSFLHVTPVPAFCWLPSSPAPPRVLLQHHPDPLAPTKAQLLGGNGLHKAGRLARPSVSFPGPQFLLLSFRLDEKGREGAADEHSRGGASRGLEFHTHSATPSHKPSHQMSWAQSEVSSLLGLCVPTH